MKKETLENLVNTQTSNLRIKDLSVRGQYKVYAAKGVAGFLDHYIMDEPYISLVKDGSVGNMFLCEEKSSFIGTLMAITPNSKIDLKYLYYAMRNIDFNKFKKGAAIPHIYFKDFKKELINYRGLKDQKHVIKILENIEHLIDLKQKQILFSDELVKL